MSVDLTGPPAPYRPRVTAQALLGLMVIAVGVLFTLDNLEIVDARNYLQYWPVGLVALGGFKLYQAARGARGWFGGLFFVAIGAWMLLERVIYIRIDARAIVPVFLVFLGGYLVWRGFGGRGGAPRGAEDGSGSFSALAIMGGVSRRSNTPRFERADLTAVMGGCEIDLRKASIESGSEAVIDVFAFWGGIDIKVPEDWSVSARVVPIMGGLEDKTHAPQRTDKRLVIRGMVVMGGVTVKNRSRRDEDEQD